MASNPQIILIDGPAGAGKTTLALELQSELNCEIVHLDYVYDGWENALSSSLTEVLVDLVSAFLKGIEFELPVYNWEAMSFDSVRIIKPAPALIIEGVGAGQSAIRGTASALYWLDIDYETGLERVLQRDGVQIESQMRAFKVSEATHFEVERTRDFADFIITTA
ncbi:MAG: uridine kinase [Candidatus Nanopelagicaceae bacterium]